MEDIKLGSAASLLDGFHESLTVFWSLEQGCGWGNWVGDYPRKLSLRGNFRHTVLLLGQKWMPLQLLTCTFAD